MTAASWLTAPLGGALSRRRRQTTLGLAAAASLIAQAGCGPTTSTSDGDTTAAPGSTSTTAEVLDVGSAVDRARPRLVFLTDTPVAAASLRGLAGADALCQAIADEVMPISGQPLFEPPLGRFRAWLSDSHLAAGERLFAGTGPYRLPSYWASDSDFQVGSQVASDWASLLSDGLVHPIELNARGKSIHEPVLVWTGTTASGATAEDGSCADWTRSEGAAWAGITAPSWPPHDEPVEAWTMKVLLPCSSMARLYCVEQE